ncbi:cell division protein FtsI (penicillin-binding protein 3) [Kineococcus xinjiangensis]|uniref:Cell division protein FtsI (Penicillin-binding protein 3) n=1 Tax=Kineococcus xinjiangensis TaxID=512762 RepID=A0A2S6IM37_9ACTN|nr:penicillin-binding protein 2 [Kineococcus xinjiangensis]PPK95241.1 cell division protein FtsI (penicillin-binding protein 3) [Kineococcus xinjiangensis]
MAQAPARRRAPQAAAGPRADRRLRAWVLAVLIVLSLFGGRLVQLQGMDASELAAVALQTRQGQQLTLHADRGDIVDANGVLLATSVERRDVVADPTVLRDFNKRSATDPRPRTKERGVGFEGAAALLAPVLGADPAVLVEKLAAAGEKDRYEVLAKGLTPEAWREIQALRIPGIASERSSLRVYPTGPAASTLVGVLGPSPDGTSELVGASGLELKLDDRLRGVDGFERYERTPQGQQIPLGVSERQPEVDGDTLHLTIDRDLQWKAQQALRGVREQTQAQSATAVIMDKQGKILALASDPSVDPTNRAGASGTSFNNTAVTEPFEPGSTAKVVTLAAGLEEGVVDPASRFTIEARLKRSTKEFKDSHVAKNPQMTLAGVIAQSSNIGTILAGERMSAETLHEYQRKFGFGEKTGLPLPGETRGIVAEPDDYSGTQRYTVMFGQGLSVNAVQAASVFATIANDGVRVQPQLLQGWTTPRGGYTPAPPPEESRAVSAATARTMRDMLQAVVSEEGTAAMAQIPGYLVAGKTGTAQRYNDECRCYSGYTASFIGMAPADDPQLVVAVIVQDPKTTYYGGSAAGPVFKELMTYALAQRKIPPSTAAPATLPLYW